MNTQQLENKITRWQIISLVFAIAYVGIIIILCFAPVKDNASYRLGFQDGQTNCQETIINYAYQMGECESMKITNGIINSSNLFKISEGKEGCVKKWQQ